MNKKIRSTLMDLRREVEKCDDSDNTKVTELLIIYETLLEKNFLLLVMLNIEAK